MNKTVTKLSHSDVADLVLSTAKQLGATAAEAGVSQSNGFSVTVRQGEVETLEHNNDKGLGITVYFGQSKATASTSDLTVDAIKKTVEAACDIARYTQADDAAGLADADLMATTFADLDLDHPWDVSVEQAIELATECEAAGLSVSERISNSEGATVASHQGDRFYANSHGFAASRGGTRHSISASLIATDAKGMQRDYWYGIARDALDLASPTSIGQKAAQRTLSRLDAGDIKTGNYPVLFAAEVAPSLFGQLISAISGRALYQGASFLLDKKGEQIFPEFIRIHEQPHLRKALGSANYDNDGVATVNRDIVSQGVLQDYVLSAYSARKLGVKTTGNAGGVHNLTVDSTTDANFDALVKQMDRGIVVMETMGMGVNIVNGDYSQGVAGFWVENGQIQSFVDELTIASNLSNMFMGIQAVGSDVELRGNTRSGSVLIDNMKIAV